MKPRTVLLVVVVCIGLSMSQEITEDPSDITVFTGMQAMFSCIMRDAPGYWILNDTNINDLSGVLRADLVTRNFTSAVFYFISLIIPGRVEYNGTRVQCAIENDAALKSETATLRIQGLLASVGSVLIATATNTSVTISWTAPFTLDVTGQPDIWYSVLIYNVTDENNPTAILCTDCINITETHYTFTPDYLSPCHVYNFSVIPVNGVGKGESTANYTSTVHGHALSDDIDLLMSEANISIFKRSIDVFKILIVAPLMVNYTVLCFLESLNLCYYNSYKEQCPPVASVVSPELVPTDGGNKLWQIESEVVLGGDCDYNVNIFLPSEACGSNNTSGSFSISTRVLTVEEMDGEIVVRCVFTHTLSESCYVQLVSSEVEGGFYQGGCVEGEGEGVHRFSGLLPASYTVLVYGLVEGEKEDNCAPAAGDPAYISVVTVSGPHPSSPISPPSATDDTTRSPNLSRSSSLLCAEGVGVGVCMGAAITCFLFVLGIIIVKLFLKYKQRKRKETEPSVTAHKHVAMERNLAYELHKPTPKIKGGTGSKQCSEGTNPIYEDLK